MDQLQDAGAAAEIAMPQSSGLGAFVTLLADDASAALAFLTAQAEAEANVDAHAVRDDGVGVNGYDQQTAIRDEAEARVGWEGPDTSDLRLDVVMAEVAAVMALIAQDDTSKDSRARPYVPPRYPVRAPLKSAEIRRLPIASVEPSRPRVVKGACTIIAFPGPAARPMR